MINVNVVEFFGNNGNLFGCAYPLGFCNNKLILEIVNDDGKNNISLIVKIAEVINGVTAETCIELQKNAVQNEELCFEFGDLFCQLFKSNDNLPEITGNNIPYNLNRVKEFEFSVCAIYDDPNNECEVLEEEITGLGVTTTFKITDYLINPYTDWDNPCLGNFWTDSVSIFDLSGQPVAYNCFATLWNNYFNGQEFCNTDNPIWIYWWNLNNLPYRLLIERYLGDGSQTNQTILFTGGSINDVYAYEFDFASINSELRKVVIRLQIEFNGQFYDLTCPLCLNVKCCNDNCVPLYFKPFSKSQKLGGFNGFELIYLEDVKQINGTGEYALSCGLFDCDNALNGVEKISKVSTNTVLTSSIKASEGLWKNPDFHEYLQLMRDSKDFFIRQPDGRFRRIIPVDTEFNHFTNQKNAARVFTFRYA